MTLTLIRTSRAYRSLAASRLVSDLGTWFAYVGLAASVYDRTHSAEWISVLLLVGLAPSVLFGFTLAPLLDRLVRRHVLVAGELAGGCAFVALTVFHGLAALLTLAAVAGVATALVRPGLSAALPNFVEARELPRANATMRAITSSAMLAGPPLAGLVVASAGAEPVFAANAASFFVSALLLSRLPRERLQQGRTPTRLRLGAGLALYRPLELRGLIASWGVAQFAWVTVNVGEILLARSAFHTGDVGFGLVAGAAGAGLLAGSLGAGYLGDRVPSGTAYRASLLVAAAGVAAAAATHSFPLALVAVATGAAGNATAISYAHLIVQRSFADARRGQAFGVFSACASSTAVAGMLLAGRLEAAAGVRAAWEVGAGVAAAAAVISWAGSRRALPERVGERFDDAGVEVRSGTAA